MIGDFFIPTQAKKIEKGIETHTHELWFQNERFKEYLGMVTGDRVFMILFFFSLWMGSKFYGVENKSSTNRITCSAKQWSLINVTEADGYSSNKEQELKEK